MRMMLRVAMPIDRSNEAIKSGALPKVLEGALKDLKPEAAYFTTIDGKRTALFFFDMKDASQMPPIAEPFFMGLSAAVDFTPAMNADDLKAGLAKTAK